MRHDPEGYYYSVTTDGDRVFLHVWAENGNWVWVLHEMRVDRGDRCFLLGPRSRPVAAGSFPGLRSSHDPHLKHSDRNMVRVECPSYGRAHWLPLGQATTRCPMAEEQHELLGLLGSGQKLHCDLPAPA